MEALAYSGATHSIISLYMAKKVNMIMLEKGEATLTNASNTRLDVSGRGEFTVQEELGFPYKISVLISKDLGREELVIGQEDLKDLGILHQDFPKTLPDMGRGNANYINSQCNSIRGDQWAEQMENKQ